MNNGLAGWKRLAPSASRTANEYSLRGFIRGQRPVLSVCSDDRVPRLGATQRILNDLLRETAGRRVRILAGPVGDGKTTALMQIALDPRVQDLYEVVHWPRDDLRPTVDGVVGDFTPRKPVLAVVDNAASHVQALHKIIREAHRLEFNALTVLAATSDVSWNTALGNDREWSSFLDDFAYEPLEPLADEHEAQEIVRLWESVGSLGALNSVKPSERATRLFEYAKPVEGDDDDLSLLGALLSVRVGRDQLGDHLKTLMVNLRGEDDPDLLRLLMLLAFGDGIGAPGLDLPLLAEALGTSIGAVRDKLEVLGTEVIADYGINARTRHPVVAAEIIRQAKASSVALRDHVLKLIAAAAQMGASQSAWIPSHRWVVHCPPAVARNFEPILGQMMAAELALDCADRLAELLPQRLDVVADRIYALNARRFYDSVRAASLDAVRDRYEYDDVESVRGVMGHWSFSEQQKGDADAAVGLGAIALSDSLSDGLSDKSLFDCLMRLFGRTLESSRAEAVGFAALCREFLDVAIAPGRFTLEIGEEFTLALSGPFPNHRELADSVEALARLTPSDVDLELESCALDVSETRFEQLHKKLELLHLRAMRRMAGQQLSSLVDRTGTDDQIRTDFVSWASEALSEHSTT